MPAGRSFRSATVFFAGSSSIADGDSPSSFFCTFLAGALLATAAERPNILWIFCEDTNPHLGCYGDPLARTSRLDAFARESVRYTHAFAYTGGCAPSRSCLITGVYPMRLGSGGMRSATRLADEVKCFTEYLRSARPD